MDLVCYALALPDVGRTQGEHRGRQDLARQTLLEDDGGAVAQVGSDAADESLEGLYRGRYAEKMAAELEELGESAGFESLPVTDREVSRPIDGYYAVENVRVDTPGGRVENVKEFVLELARRGTKASHYRTIESVQAQVDHGWGTAEEALVGVPAAAEKVRWFDAESGDWAAAAPAETRSAELGDVEMYDLDAGEAALDVADPALIYQIDYLAEKDTDVRVYDTRGEADKLDAEGLPQWQKLFSTQHDLETEIVIDSGRLRLYVDDPSADLSAEEYDAGAEEWQSISLGDNPDSWAVYDADLTAVRMASARAQLVFIDEDDDLFALDATLDRAAENVLFSIPPDEDGPVPDSLEDWLDPIASTSIVDPQPTKTLTSRSRVRK